MAKSSKSQKTERQKLIEETLKKQRTAEKKRGNAIVLVAVAIAVVIIGVATYPMARGAFEESKYEDDALSEIGAAASTCQDVVEKAGSDVGSHVDEPQQVTYDAAPPAYGAHWNAIGAPAPFEDKFYDADDRPELEQLVHNLEHGYTILWYDETIADDATQLGQIRAIANKFKESGDAKNYRNKFIAAPWLDSDEDGARFPDGQHVAFTHWKGTTEESTGVWQYCGDVSGAALETFMDTYPYTDAPEATII
ncbi:DUF3105 domain-containing protein [Nocardioides sp. 1609]|uniref:DUF3105 domain-containing protein n=1 Tax=Nocardioides sp. 1609 TaxID=2508327 RepID=UPI0010702198|nr:DUF3105 domain-containing protein [Nocardioides sp. 1609]